MMMMVMVPACPSAISIVPGEPINLMAHSARERERTARCLISNVAECLLTLITLSRCARGTVLLLASVAEWSVKLAISRHISPALFPHLPPFPPHFIIISSFDCLRFNQLDRWQSSECVSVLCAMCVTDGGSGIVDPAVKDGDVFVGGRSSQCATITTTGKCHCRSSAAAAAAELSVDVECIIYEFAH